MISLGTGKSKSIRSHIKLHGTAKSSVKRQRTQTMNNLFDKEMSFESITSEHKGKCSHELNRSQVQKWVGAKSSTFSFSQV